MPLGVSILSLDVFPDTFHLPGPLPSDLGSPHTLHPPNFPSSSPQIWAPLLCSYPAQRPLRNTMVLDLLFIQQISFDLLPRSWHWDGPVKTKRERGLPLGALGVGKIDNDTNGVTVDTRGSLEGHVVQSWRRKEFSRKLIPTAQWPRNRATMRPLWDSQG